MELRVRLLWSAGWIFWAVTGSASSDLRLIEAVKHRDPKAARLLLKQGADVNAAQADGATALAWAAFVDDRETAEMLLAAGAKANTADEYGETPLTLAAANGDAALVGKLLQAGADPNAAQWNHETALMKAANSGSLAAVQLLLDKGADVNAAESAKGQTALMWAAAERHSEIVKLLIDRGASVHAASKAGSTALVFSAIQNDVASIRYELKAGADPNYALPGGARVLALAAAGRHTAAAATLIDGGADYLAADPSGDTVIHIAAQTGDLELVQKLLAKGVDPNLHTAKPTASAAGRGRGGSRNRRLPGEMTPLMMAARYGHEDIMRVLVAAGAQPQLKAQDHSTLLMFAANSGKLPAVQNAYRLDPAAAREFNEGGNNAVHASVTGGGPATHEAHHEIAEIIKFLWEKGTEIDIKNGQNLTAIEVCDRLPIDQAVDMITELLHQAGREPIVATQRK